VLLFVLVDFTVCFIVLFLPPPPMGRLCRKHYVSRSSSMTASVLASRSLLARYLRKQWRDFHQTLFDVVVEAKDEVVRF